MKTTSKILIKSELAEVKAVYKLGRKASASEMPKVTSSVDAAKYIKSVWPEGSMEYRESMLLLMLNRANRVLGWAVISVGGVSGTVADPKLIFQQALITNSSYLILAHNHPSGNAIPSPEDIKLTKKIVEGSKLLDLQIVDHIILTEESHYSFAEEGLL